MLYVNTTPWVRANLRDEEAAYLQAVRTERRGTLSLSARTMRGPFLAKLRLVDGTEHRVEGATLAGVLRGLIERVAA